MIAAQRKLQVPPKRKGLTRLWFALNHSLSGMQIAAKEPAVRLELATAAVLVPAAFWVGKGPVEQVLLLASVVAVLVVEVLNTAIEAAIDRVGAEYHPCPRRPRTWAAPRCCWRSPWPAPPGASSGFRTGLEPGPQGRDFYPRHGW
ncbi:diacylglycerol kinase [Comamonas endophytica]|uniref:diacylglycerol kinase n=1 Tax=Comamonas endophytica TaxID=2949090 RepID=UPI00361E5604